MEVMIRDLREACRALRRAPGFTVVAVLTIALGIGPGTAVFSALDAALWRPLPYAGADRLATLHLTYRNGAESRLFKWSYPKFETLRGATTALDEVAAFAGNSMSLTGVASPERLAVEMVSPRYFPILGVRPLLGRLFLPSEETAKEPVALLGEALWRRRFGADRGIVGSVVGLNGRSFTVLGIVPAGFRPLSGPADAWIPLALAPAPEMLANRWLHWLMVVARLKPGVEMAKASAEIALAGRRVDAAHPSPVSKGETWGASLVPLEETRVEAPLRRSLGILMGAAACVLLLSVVNLSGLLLARIPGQRREIAIRIAVGGSRARLVRRRLAEALVLSFLGGTVGLALGAATLEGLSILGPEAGTAFQGMAYLVDVTHTLLDSRAVLFGFGLSLLTAIGVGVVTGLSAWRQGVTQPFQDQVGRRDRSDVASLAAALQLAVACVLLVGAGLMLKSFWRLLHVDAGFDREGLLTFSVETPARRKGDGPAFREEVLSRLAGIPGAASVSVGSCVPLSGRCSNGLAWAADDGRTGERSRVEFDFVSPAHFRTLGMAVRSGRALQASDRADGSKVVVVNESLARSFWPGQDPLGKRLTVGPQQYRKDEPAVVVGVVRDVRYGRPEEDPRPHAYLPDAQAGPSSSAVTMVFLRTSGDPARLAPATRATVAALEPNVPIFDVKSMKERIAGVTSRTRFAAAVLLLFAVLAVVLACVGTFGVMSYALSHRRREIGIRLALGARPDDVFWSFLGRGLRLTGAGLLTGIAGALLLARGLVGLLFGVEPIDPPTLAASVVLLGTMASVGSLLPALAALKVDPITVLQAE